MGRNTVISQICITNSIIVKKELVQLIGTDLKNAYNDYMSATGKIGHSSGRIDDLYSLDTESDKWRLKNESRLHKIVSESIDRVIKNM